MGVFGIETTQKRPRQAVEKADHSRELRIEEARDPIAATALFKKATEGLDSAAKGYNS